MKEKILHEFTSRFGAPPAVMVRAPGRVNLIGEHTDYNAGFVLPVAIDLAVWIALRPRPDRRVIVHSLDFTEIAEFFLDDLQKGGGWVEYLKGMAWAMQVGGCELQGWEGVLAGDIPIGAGLSSSAAVEMASARAFAAVSNLPWSAVEMAKLGQEAENRWLGVNCGIMDQMISAGGVAGHALLIDCRTLETRPVPLPLETLIVVLDTSTRRGLVDSAYNQRRAQCEAAANVFGVPALRDVSLAQFEARAGELDAVTRRRARHVISENERTLQAAAAMQRGDMLTLGSLMDASHESLRDDFEVTNDALNAIVTCARRQAGCLGARMTGAGFGGCAVALVRSDSISAFGAGVQACYEQSTGLKAGIHICTASAGAQVIG